MRIVAVREGFACATYVFSMIISLIVLGYAIYGSSIFFIVVGTYLVFFSVGFIIDYFSNPKTPIILNEQNDVVLHSGVTLKATDIIDVSYRKSLARFHQLPWGTLDITSKVGNFRYRYIRDCEDVSKYLMKLKNRASKL